METLASRGGKALRARRVEKPRTPMNPNNPTVCCDTCPRTQAADMVTRAAAGVWICDVCRVARRREREG